MIRSLSPLLWAAWAVALLLLVPSTSRAADISRAFDYVPQDAQIVVALDGDEVKASPVFKRIVPALIASEPSARRDFNEFKRKTGFDPFKHVRGAVLAFGDGFPKDQDHFVFIVDAQVSEQRLVSFMKSKGADLELKNDKLGRWYTLGGRDEGAMAFRGPHVIIASAKLMPAALAKRGSQSPLVAKTKSAIKTEALVVMAKPNPTLRKELGREMPELDQVTELFAALKFPAGGLDLRTNLGFSSPATPSKLASQINQQLAQLAQEREIQRMGLDTVLKQIKVNAVGNELQGSLSLPSSEVDRLISFVERLL